MRLAWFRAAESDSAAPSDDVRDVLAELEARHDIAVFNGGNAHDFVWMHFRRPYDLCVHELDDTRTHQFVWPYLLHYGGVLLLRSWTLNASRTDALARDGRIAEHQAELAFAGGPLVRAPLLAARLVAVPDVAIADALQQEYPEARIRCVPAGVRAGRARVAPGDGTAIVFGVPANGRVAVCERAMARAQQAGARAALVVSDSMDDLVAHADVVLALHWPPVAQARSDALCGMAAGLPVVLFETDATAHWPALNPQTWRARDLRGGTPQVVSVDPRDEEHSIMLAIRRLADAADLRAQLGAAGHAWWQAHATTARAAAAWERILEEAAALQPPPRPADWPAHLTADGTETARRILAEIGTDVDLVHHEGTAVTKNTTAL